MVSAMAYSRETQSRVLELLGRGYTQREVAQITGVSVRTQRRWLRQLMVLHYGEPLPTNRNSLSNLVDVDHILDHLLADPELASAEGQRALVACLAGAVLASLTAGDALGDITPAQAARLLSALASWARELKHLGEVDPALPKKIALLRERLVHEEGDCAFHPRREEPEREEADHPSPGPNGSGQLEARVAARPAAKTAP